MAEDTSKQQESEPALPPGEDTPTTLESGMTSRRDPALSSDDVVIDGRSYPREGGIDPPAEVVRVNEEEPTRKEG